MDAVGAEVDGAAGVNEVVDTYSALRGEVENAGVGVGAVVLRVVGRSPEGRVLVIGPEEAAGSLSPEGEALRSDNVPTENDGGDGGAGVGAAYGVGDGALCGGAGGVDAEGTLVFGGVGLPEGEGFDGVFEVAAKQAMAEVGREDLTDVDARHEELESAAFFGETVASLHDCTEFKVATTREVLLKRVDVVLKGWGRGLSRTGPWGGEGQESQGPNGGCADALQVPGHALNYSCTHSETPGRLTGTEEGRRWTAAV